MRAFLTRKYRSQPCTSSRGRRLGWLGTAPPHGDMARTGAPVKSELSAGYYGRSSRPTTIGGEVVRHGRPRRVRGQRNACACLPQPATSTWVCCAHAGRDRVIDRFNANHHPVEGVRWQAAERSWCGIASRAAVKSLSTYFRVRARDQPVLAGP
jgi:hypothetical protein